jgi:precorrin-6B methylase 2
MNVDTQVMQSSVYVYGDKSQKHTDVDYELFGLDIVSVSIVRAAFAAAKEPTVRDLFVNESTTLDKLVSAVKQSAKTLDNIIL